jgi:hypothetical protein
MATGRTNPRANPNASALASDRLAHWGRTLALATAVVFFISSVFPVVAGLSKNTESFPKWWGPLDVGIAFVLALLAMAVLALTEGNVSKQAESASYRAYRILTHGILAMGVIFMLFGDRIVLINCFTGLAWRTWLLLYSLPAWFTALRAAPGVSGSS